MYEPYPGGGGAMVPEPSRPPVPPSVTNAVRAMYLGAAASLIGIIISLTTVSSVKAQIHRARPDLTPSKVNSTEHGLIAILIIEGLIAIGLWLWMARSCKAGKNWARITATVFFGLDTIGQIAAAAEPTGTGDRIYSLVVWLIGLVAIAFLWQRKSSEYFKFSQVPR